jgi:hypothetical protein
MSPATRGPAIPAALAAWLIYLALDFLSHAVLLASWWRATETYWLPPMEMFRRIPLGYTSFAIYCAGLTWLLLRLYGEQVTVTMGLRVGVIAGLAFGLTTTVGGYSILRLPVSYLLVAPITITIESAAAGGVAAWVLRGTKRWRRAGQVAGLAVLLFIVGVVAQNLFVATPEDHMIP